VKVVIVDDEAPARAELRHLLAAHPEVQVAGEAASATEAASSIAGCDAVFLDIELVGASGLDAARLLRAVARPPAVVFVTAHAEYAVDAFAVEAFDYLLKPVDPERLARVVARLAERRPQAAEPRRIPVVAAGRTGFVDQDQVHYVRAEGDYSRVYTYERSYLSPASLRELEAALPAERFLRIHRSYLVNLAKVASVRRAGSDRLLLALDDGKRTELEVARRQAARARAALKLG
jgi:DNA-binding LytR/AlgR family response regulator